MKLYEYVHKNIRIQCIDGQVIEGKCTGYIQDIDNTPEIASAYVEDIEVYENEIEEIWIID